MRQSGLGGNISSFLYLTRDTFVLPQGVRVQIDGIDPNAQPVGDAPAAAIYNFYLGNDPAKWMTNAKMFQSVRLDNAYPGVKATFTASTTESGTPIDTGLGEIVFSIAPNADPSPIRLRIFNAGNPLVGPDHIIRFSGGNFTGAFEVAVRATQVAGVSPVAIAASLQIESPDTLSVQIPGRNPALATEVEVSFPDGDLISPRPLGALLAFSVQYPASFGQDGAGSSYSCDESCADAAIALLDASGKPLWVTVLGGSKQDNAAFAELGKNGVAIAGDTWSGDFAVPANAALPVPGSRDDAFIALLNSDTGALLSSTYAGLLGMANVQTEQVDANGDIAIGGLDERTDRGFLGYVLRWRPSENRFIFRRTVDFPVASVAFDSASNLFFAATQNPGSTGILTGEVDPSGAEVASELRISVPLGAQPYNVQVLPAGIVGDLWLGYLLRQPDQLSVGSPLVAMRVSLLFGRVLLNWRAASQATSATFGLTPSVNLKVLAQTAGPTEATTPNAPLVAGCPETSYFAIFSQTGELVYATYVPNAGFDFSAQNETGVTPPPVVACLAATAGRSPTAGAAPGELITITGGGFGPRDPVYTVPGANGQYPLQAAGFHVQIGARPAPIIALARGLIAVQVPYESALGGQLIVVSDNGQTMNPMGLNVVPHFFRLFDTADRNNATNLPALAALNQDGTVNTQQNPATAGSVVSLFGSGLGALSPPLETGGTSAIPPAGPLSETSLNRNCDGCAAILYLGSAPGLSTAVDQINVRLPADVLGNGVRPHAISIAVSENALSIPAPPQGVVFVK